MKKIKGIKKMTVNVKGQDYEIILCDKALSDFDGQTSTDNKTISLLAYKDRNDFKSVLLHELFHAFFFECGLVTKCHDELLVEWLERNAEIICNIASTITKLVYERKR